MNSKPLNIGRTRSNHMAWPPGPDIAAGPKESSCKRRCRWRFDPEHAIEQLEIEMAVHSDGINDARLDNREY